jgi:septal ring factor EnvC (AmiA/AmiB activator)
LRSRARTFADAARRLHYLTYVSRDAARIIDTHRAGLAELARLKDASEDKARELAELEAQGRAGREQLLKERREQRRFFERLSGEIRSARKQDEDAGGGRSPPRAPDREIGKLLVARPGAGYRREAKVGGRVSAVPEAGAPAAAAGVFSHMKGSLRLPVRGELVGRYGAQRSTGTASAKGVFIRAAEGEAVRGRGARKGGVFGLDAGLRQPADRRPRRRLPVDLRK